MRPLLFLYRHRLAYLQRTAYFYMDYDPRKRDWVELSYVFYLVILLAFWAIGMLSWAVFTLGNVLSGLRLPIDALEPLVFFGLALWLVATPLLAYLSSDLYKFDLADLDFLVNAPIPPPPVALVWYSRSLFKIAPGIFVLACAVIASSVSYAQKDNDWLRLALGALGGAGFVLTAFALRWILGLLRYRRRPAFSWLLGYGLTGLGALLLLLPWSHYIFVPAWFASALLIGPLDFAAVAALALFGLALILIGLVYRVAQGTLLAPAFETGKLGGQVRLAAKAGGTVASEARLERHLSRQFQQNRPRTTHLPVLEKARLVGLEGALVYRQLLRLKRLPPSQLLPLGLGLIFIGGSAAPGLAALVNSAAPSFAIAVQVVYFANLSLIRLGTGGLRRELAHPDFFFSWPASRRYVLAYHLLPGFGLALASGEIVLLGLVAIQGAGLAIGLLVWPGLLFTTAALVLLEYERLLRKWPATPETVPKTGSLLLLVVGLPWLGTVMLGPFFGLIAAVTIVVSYSTFVNSRL